MRILPYRLPTDTSAAFASTNTSASTLSFIFLVEFRGFILAGSFRIVDLATTLHERTKVNADFRAALIVGCARISAGQARLFRLFYDQVADPTSDWLNYGFAWVSEYFGSFWNRINRQLGNILLWILGRIRKAVRVPSFRSCVKGVSFNGELLQPSASAAVARVKIG